MDPKNADNSNRSTSESAVELKRAYDFAYPGLLDLLSPRRYESCGPYGSTSGVAVSMASCLHVVCSAQQFDPPSLHAAETAVRLAQNSVPTYFVARDFFHAAVMSKTNGLKWSDVQWPLPAMLFMLPKGVLTSPLDGDITAIAVARQPAGTLPLQLHPRMRSQGVVFKHDFMSFVCFSETCFFAGQVLLGDPVGDIHDLNRTVLAVKDDGTLYQETLTPSEGEFIPLLESVCARLLMICSARPNLIRPAKLKREATLGKKAKSALWSPNIIGAEYRMPKEDEASGEGSDDIRVGRRPRMHIRLGHLRNQRYGTGLSLEKSIWIEPMVVAAD